MVDSENERIFEAIRVLPRTTWELDLSGKPLTSLTGSALPEWLRKLVLNNTQLTTLEGVQLPQCLQKLYLQNTPLTELKGLVFPDALQKIVLSCTKIITLKDVVLPEQLQELWVDGTQLKSLDGVTLPKGLKRLYLNSTPLSSLEGVTMPDGLQSLLLNNTLITNITGISLPTGLRVLAMRESCLDTLQGVILPSQLEELILTGVPMRSVYGVVLPKNLRNLDLSYTSLHSLYGMDLPDNLQQLSLNGTYLMDLDQVDLPSGLTYLNLGYTELTHLPDSIRSLKKLKVLDLSGLELSELPEWLPDLGIPFTREQYANGNRICLHNATIKGVDMSIFDQPYEVVTEWFRNRDKVALNEIKVVFLGDGEAGKSHTIARLMNDGGEPKGYVNVRTPGIVIKDLHQPVEGRDTTLHLWDFGGQDIMHSMHRIFLTERTLYVVLVDGSIGNQDERARYWLQNIQSFAKDAPVLLVLNKLDDDLQADVNAVDLREKYRGLKRILKLSALQYSKERFNREFRDALFEEVAKTGYLDVQWPKAWIQVKNELEQMKPNYIHGEDYLRVCAEFHVDSNQKDLLKWFHDLGISFCYCDGEYEAMEDYVVLKPNWITNALYIILFNEREGGNGGLVPIHTIRTMLGRNAPNKEAIKRVIPDAYYAGYDVNYVLDVFHVFRLSFQTDKYHEFFPMLADVNARHVAKQYSEDDACLEFTMEFDYLPNNLLHRLMVERQTEMDMDNVWRTGAKFELKELELSAVVIIDGNILKFYVRHENENHRPNTYLTMLKANVDRIVNTMGLKSPTSMLVYKLGGKRDYFDYEILKMLLDVGQTMVLAPSHRRMIPIQNILDQSAPDELIEEHQLLMTILRACGQIQREPECWGTKEDVRNRRMRDALEMAQYNVFDQRQLGISGAKKDVGELDLMLYRGNQIPWSIIEALRIYDGAKGNWNAHLAKVIENYNPHGVPFLFLISYADCGKKRFDEIWKEYERHIQSHHCGNFTYVDQSYELLTGLLNNHYLQIAKTRYRCGEYTPTAYHIFVQMNPKLEDATE